MIREIKQSEYYPVSTTILDSLDLYVNNRRPVGGFLSAVLENNLLQAFSRADDYNSKNMKNIVGFIYNEVPYECYGSPVKVAAWLKGGA